jgi:hypothetical protein
MFPESRGNNPAKLFAGLTFVERYNLLFRIYFRSLREISVNTCCTLPQLLFLPKTPAKPNLLKNSNILSQITTLDNCLILLNIIDVSPVALTIDTNF